VIYGIGTDLVEIGRIEAALARFGARFVERILGPQEQARYAARRARSAQRGVAFLATRFAAKEAVSKAIGLGLRAPMTWRAVEIVNAPSGQPLVLAHGALAEYLAARRLRLSVSVTDERAMAMAFAVAEVAAEERKGED
jgi:holo-[acyl-carrier protein] synthase